MPSSAKKRRRAGLNDEAGIECPRRLLATKGISQTTLRKTMRVLRSDPEVLNATQGDIDAANVALVESVRADIVLPRVSAEEFTWDLCDPNLLMARLLRDCDHLSELYVARQSVFPCSRERPWSAAIVFGEMTPGSLSHPQHHRKTMQLAFIFLEVGEAALSSVSTWYLPVALRAMIIKTTVGGWSRCLRDYLRLHFVGGLSVQDVGVPVEHRGVVHTMHARISCICSDGEGLTMCFSTKGAVGIRACPLRCSNVLRKKNSGLARRRPGFVEITCADAGELAPTTADQVFGEVNDILAAHAELEAGAMSLREFDRL
jgi:hypothetical protein